ncbi:hypothetical protein fugu_008632 [Takifugu bimaculatus]|uniref:Coiled-coil domain-containing protein 15 n=1 Tax=Takifugu bimaculatus TaxID=433685 RepID=A0A4Z2AWH8_9TELE|nr:hypothetical protein fugu_008632 [Takifugu bimaculatus]
MNLRRHLTPTIGWCKSSSGGKQEHRSSRSTKVLAERNQAVVPVGAWVEVEHDFLENPADAALLAEEIQTERMRETEENLRRFQRKVRHRVAQHAQLTRKRHLNPEGLIHHEQVWTQHVWAGETLLSAGHAAQHSLNDIQESGEDMRQVRLRLAACRVTPCEEKASQPPGEKRNIASSKHKSASYINDEDEEGGEDVQSFTTHHDCLLVKQKLPGQTWDSTAQSKQESDPSSQSCMSTTKILWPLTDHEKELKKQRQSHFQMHRQLCMNVERRQVKENEQHKKHMKRTASIKAEKERLRLEEERRLERDLQLGAERKKLQEREQLILERLRLEEEERAAELQRRKQEKEKVDARFIQALKARLKERLSQVHIELPPLCFCAASFWDTHPETCANNCVFHNNHKAYAKALHSTMLSFDLQ